MAVEPQDALSQEACIGKRMQLVFRQRFWPRERKWKSERKRLTVPV